MKTPGHSRISVDVSFETNAGLVQAEQFPATGQNHDWSQVPDRY